MSAKKVYESGLLNNEIKAILSNAKKVGEIVKEEVGQEKFVDILPYFAICAKCGKILCEKDLDVTKGGATWMFLLMAAGR